MTYSWIEVNNRLQLILLKKNKVIDKFFLPSIIDTKFFKAVIDNNGIFEIVGHDIFKIFFDKEEDIKILIDDFLNPRTIMFKMEGKS